MLAEYGIAVVPGSVFGSHFTRHFRLCFACSTEDVREGMAVFSEAFRS